MTQTHTHTHTYTVEDIYTSAIIAAAQQYPSICDELINDTHEQQGIYGVALYVDGDLTMVWVDALFPCWKREAAAPTAPWT